MVAKGAGQLWVDNQGSNVMEWEDDDWVDSNGVLGEEDYT